MILDVDGMWSSDLVPDASGVTRPPDLTDFSVFVEVFVLTVCSPSELERFPSGMFVSHTLVLDRFSWDAIRERLEALLMHVRSAPTWADVITKLSGTLAYSDA